MDNLTTLITLSYQINELDMLQEWIDEARVAVPKNRVAQRKLDYCQEDLDRRRALIEITMIDIRNRN